MPGQFFWYDVMTTDTAAARNFYCKVLGWEIQADSGAADMEYTVFTVKGRGVAGLMPIPEDARRAGVRPAWMGYISVDDVDNSAARLVREGGKVHRPPSDVPGIIRFAVVADSQGAGFLIAKALVADAPPELPIGTPGTVGWRELYAAEGSSAFAFYETLFGWSKGEAHDMGPLGTYQIFATANTPAGGIMTKPAAVPMPCWGYYFNVDGIDDAAKRVTAGGGRITNGPHEVPGGQWIVQCTDPQGAAFALVAMHR